MSERFISFSTPMVQAQRAGRKTQTRRICKTQVPSWANKGVDRVGPWHHFKGNHPRKPCESPVCAHTPGPVMFTIKCPYGKVGDILRVREAAWMWCEKKRDGLTPKRRPKFRYVPSPMAGPSPIYVADYPAGHRPTRRTFTSKTMAGIWGYRLKIPRFLPAWAVRTRLRITGIRVERLNDISEEDAVAEGCDDFTMDEGVKMWSSAVEAFSELWDSINGAGAWNQNPWVWVLNFEPVKP